MASFGRNLEIMLAVREVNRRLAGVATAVERDVKETMITQASLIAAEIKRVAPIGQDSDNPGALRDSVRVEEGKSTAKKAFVVKIKAGGSKTEKSAYQYPRAVEFGTQKAPAHPFFWPIFRLRRKGARQAIRKQAVESVRKVFGDK